MDVGDSRLRQIVVNHHLHALEVYSSRHKVRADEDPDVSGAEAPNDLLSLRGRPLGMHHIHVDSVVNEFAVKLLQNRTKEQST
jgi:hypothetical protein